MGRQPKPARVHAVETVGDVVHLVEREMHVVIAIRTCRARELRVGFDVGLYERADVAAWVEREILASPAPSDELLELTTLSPRTDTEIATLLDALDPCGETESFVLRVKAVGSMFYGKELHAQGALEKLRLWANSDTAIGDEVCGLHEQMDLASRGIDGSVSAIEEELAALFARVWSE